MSSSIIAQAPTNLRIVLLLSAMKVSIGAYVSKCYFIMRIR